MPPSDLYGFRSSNESYNYRFGSFVDSPHPEIILRYDAESGFALDTSLMLKPKLSPDARRAAARKVREDKESWQLPRNFLPGAYLRPIFDIGLWRRHGGGAGFRRSGLAHGKAWTESLPCRSLRLRPAGKPLAAGRRQAQPDQALRPRR